MKTDDQQAAPRGQAIGQALQGGGEIQPDEGGLLLFFNIASYMIRNEITDLKKIVYDLAGAVSGKTDSLSNEGVKVINRLYGEERGQAVHNGFTIHQPMHGNSPDVIEVEETLSLQEKEIDMIKKALRKHKGKRKNAARELGISERTLYRKINEYAIED